MKKIIQGGILVDPGQGICGPRDILIEDGRVRAVAPQINLAEAEGIKVPGCFVIPGLVDMHTHLREPGLERKETIASGSRAAAAGGYTSITALPNTSPVTDSPEKIRRIKEIAQKDSMVRVWPVGAVTLGSAGQALADIGGMVAEGAVAVTDDGRGVQSAGLLRKALLLCRELGIPLLEHCEDESLSAGGIFHDDLWLDGQKLPGIPAVSETVMLARDLLLAAETGARLHVMHVSTAKGVELLRWAKQRGIAVTAEVTPHHLLLTFEDAVRLGAAGKMKPPLRSREDMLALREALADGTIDAVATDHAPHGEEEKMSGLDAAPFGVVGLETAFTLLYTHLVAGGFMSLPALVERMSLAPARILGIEAGTLAPGSPADLTVIDPRRETAVDRNKFFSKGKNTPFDGMKGRGTPVLTMVGGSVVMKEGCIL